MFPESDEMISMDRRYSHAKSINCQIPVQANAYCRRKGTKWTNLRASTEARIPARHFSFLKRNCVLLKRMGRITAERSEMSLIIRDVA